MTPVFVDFEASSLGHDSYPVEAAWMDESGQSESYLVRPEPDWSDWSDEAQAVHGLSRRHLLDHGSPALHVARRLRAALTPPGAVAVVGSGIDLRWLGRLLSLTHAVDPGPSLVCARLLLTEVLAATVGSVPPSVGREVVRRVAVREGLFVRRPRHRALSEATLMRRVWVGVVDEVRAFHDTGEA